MRYRKKAFTHICGISIGVTAMVSNSAVDVRQEEKVVLKEETSVESFKRRAPRVQPVEYKGIQYSQLRDARSYGFGQSGGVVLATSVESGKHLWTLQIYKIEYDADEEMDAQEVYIAHLSIDEKHDALIVEDERGRRYAVRLADRTVAEQ